MYNATVLELFQNARNQGNLADADLTGQEGISGQGPFLVMTIKIEGERIAEARFETYGCPAAVACGSWVTIWVTGKTREQASILEADDLLKILGGLPLGKEHCASLAVHALKDAITQWQS